MKVIGIEIDKKRVICIALDKNEKGNISKINTNTKFFEIKDDLNCEQIRHFTYEIHEFFNQIKPDCIAIQIRQTKGRFSAAPSSFKLEGLIQMYDKLNVEFVSPQTLSAFYKKNEMTITFENKYQDNAAKLANFLLNK